MDKGVVVTFGEPLMQHFIDSGFDYHFGLKP
jgi:hypothetical protein